MHWKIRNDSHIKRTVAERSSVNVMGLILWLNELDLNCQMRLDKPIVVAEIPKSGGSWITSMLGDALGVPQRDIYVKPGFDLFDIKKHPWYSGSNDLDLPRCSVIKSHEFPESGLVDFDAKYVHLVRDGRDVVVSKWYFYKYFCVNNGIAASFDIEFDVCVKKTAAEWANYVEAWRASSVLLVHYEDFLQEPVGCLERLIKSLIGAGVEREALERTVDRFSKENFSRALGEVFEHNTFVRKGVAGDWVNHFSEKNIADFKAVAGETLLSLRYESSRNWGGG